MGEPTVEELQQAIGDANLRIRELELQAAELGEQREEALHARVAAQAAAKEAHQQAEHARKSAASAGESTRQLNVRLREAERQRARLEVFVEQLHKAGRVTDDELAATRAPLPPED